MRTVRPVGKLTRRFEGWRFQRWRRVRRDGRWYVYIRVESPRGEFRDVYIGRAGTRRPPGRPRKDAPPDTYNED